MTMTVRGLKALGRVVRLQTAVEMQLPVEMQLALLSLAVGEGELGAERPGLQAAALEMTEHAHDHASIPQKRVAAADKQADVQVPSPPIPQLLPVPHRTSA
jgi:hypothetical protein